MKIFLVAQNYLPFVGGVEVHVRQVAGALRDCGHDVDVVAVNFVPPKLPARLNILHQSLLAPRYESYQDRSVPVHALTPSPLDRLLLVPIAVRVVPRLQRIAYDALNRLGYVFYKPVFGPPLRHLIQNADLVHSFAFGHLGWTAQAVAADLKIPFVCTPFVHPHQWGDGPDDVAYYRRADAVIALVETDKQYLASLGISESRLHVIGVSPNLPPSADGAGFRSRHQLGNSAVVLYVGRMMAQKGAAATLAAARLVWQKTPEARFIFIGPASAAEADVFKDSDSRILYLGKVSDQEKADALSACDIFCMPSTSEILPTVYLEAWNYGKPVVGGIAHGLRELVEGNGAGIIAEQNPALLAEILIKLLADPSLRTQLGERGRRLVAARYSVDAVTDAFCSLYSGLTAARGQRSSLARRLEESSL
jgi:phosphatidylinositol alpha-1,6-mannosyltransferase